MSDPAEMIVPPVLHGDAGARWRPALLLGGLGAALLVLFHRDVADLAGIWWTSSTYNHCLLIPPILAWLVWQRRAGLARLYPAPWALPLLWVAAGAFAWLLGHMASVALFRHAALIMMAQGLVMAILGRPVSRALTFPLCYAFFLVPMGSELEPVLQILTARMAVGLLWLTGIPAHIEGIFITIPSGYFRVAEACSGTAFLIAMAAYATLVANQCFRGTARRLAFVAAALVTCLLANGVRAYGIIAFADHAGIESAVVVDHIVYGWLFFALVILVVMLAGMRWFDRHPDDGWFDPQRLQSAPGKPARVAMVVPAALALMVAPLGWAGVARVLADPLSARTALPDVPGWTRIADPAIDPWRPHFAGADRLVMAHYRDRAGRVVDLAIVLFAHQADGKELVGFGQGAASPDGAGGWAWSAPASAPAGAKGEFLAGPRGEQRRALTYYLVDGTLTGSASAVKLATLKARLLARDQRAVAILLSAGQKDDPAESDRTLRDFLQALGPVKSLADRSLDIR